MSDVAAGTALLLALVVLAALHVRGGGRGAVGAEPWLPGELRGAELAFSEQRFVSRRHGLVARLDRAYRVAGVLHLVELKTRNNLHAQASDVVELSVQRFAVQEQTGQTVSPVAYVAVQQGGRGTPRPIRVQLLEEAEIMAMRRRLLEVRAARGREPAPARSASACRNCGHRETCQRTFGDRGQVGALARPGAGGACDRPRRFGR